MRLDLLTPKQRLAASLAEKLRRKRLRRIYDMYPETGPLRRELYPKHMEFMRLGAEHRERLACCGNRVGKTEGMGGYELTWHLLGEYPDWWQGRRFDRPISSWAAGDTGKTTRNILQRKLMGPPGAIGTGLIPGARIKRATPKAGIADGIELVYVESAQGGLSLLEFKSYDQRREGFQGTEQDVILLDEEPPEDVYDECLLRTVETPGRPGGGIIMLTYTPIKGLTPLTLRFLPEYAPVEDESREGEE